jgi:hypothetical protein
MLGLGIDRTCSLHDPHFDFNDELIPFAALVWTKIVEIRG